MEEKTTVYADLVTSHTDDTFTIHGAGQFDHETKVLTKAEALLLYAKLHNWLNRTAWSNTSFK